MSNVSFYCKPCDHQWHKGSIFNIKCPLCGSPHVEVDYDEYPDMDDANIGTEEGYSEEFEGDSW